MLIDPVTVMMDGVAHLANGGEVVEQQYPGAITWMVPLSELTWCDKPTAGGHVPRAADLLAGPLDICFVCRAIAALQL